MEKKSFELLPCIFCTIGYNCYVAGHNITAKGYQSWGKLKSKKPVNESVIKSTIKT